MDRAAGIHAAHARDPLTGLAGRDAACERLAAWLDEGRDVHAALLGLRRFGAVNLAYGRSGGDAVLGEVAQRLRGFAGSELDGAWFAARTGGGQFLLASAEPVSREHWGLVIAQLQALLARPIALGQGGVLRLAPRAALVRALEGEGAEPLLDQLGATLAQVMEHPARRLGWADGGAARTGRSAAQLDADLLRAADLGEIEVVYQPQWRCADDRLIGAEALARWNHPRLGRIGAGALFAIAERADHVAQLSRHIAALALAGASDWPEPLRLSLNLTPTELAAADFVSQFSALIAESGFSPGRLTAEITEQVLLADVAHAAEVLGALAGQGIAVSLDDFGAGFCNFRYLKALPLAGLKLDRSMVEGIAEDPRDLAVLRAILAMAGALGLKVVAEGIESEAQRAVLAAEGCHAWQGFLRAPPLSRAEFSALA